MTCRRCVRTLKNEFRKFEGIDYLMILLNKYISYSYSSTDYKRESFEKAIEPQGYLFLIV